MSGCMCVYSHWNIIIVARMALSPSRCITRGLMNSGGRMRDVVVVSLLCDDNVADTRDNLYRERDEVRLVSIELNEFNLVVYIIRQEEIIF